MKDKMSRLGPLQLAIMLLCIAPPGGALAVERHVPSQYPTIQQAVDAAVSGDTIRIAPGHYTEQVVVTFKTGLTLAGEPGTILHAFPGMTATLEAYLWSSIAVCAIYRSEVVVSGLHFEGENLGGSLPSSLEGLLFLSSGGTITNCIFSGFRAGGTSDQNVAMALHCENLVAVQPGHVSVTIVGNNFLNNQTAIRLTGDGPFNPEQLRLTARVHGNIFTGFGPAPGWNAGIWLACGVRGDFTQNSFGGFAGLGSLGSAAIAGADGSANAHGRFVPLQMLNFEANTFTDNGQQLTLVGANHSRVVNNKFLGSVPGALARGALDVSGTNILVANNNFAEMPTGIRLVGNESWPPPWPALPPAANPSLTANWFCNVPEPIRVDPLVTIVQEQGTQTNCPFAPEFQSMRKGSNGEFLALLRGWHGDSYVVETSTNLQHWVPVQTNQMALPLLEITETNTSANPRRFYRTLKQ